MSRGVPQGLSTRRSYRWHPLYRGCDEYARLTWTIAIPKLGGVTWHTPWRCSTCFGCDLWNATRNPAHVDSMLRAKVRLWDMWERGLRARHVSS